MYFANRKINLKTLFCYLAVFVIVVSKVRYSIVTCPYDYPEYIELFDNYFSAYQYLFLRLCGTLNAIGKLILFCLLLSKIIKNEKKNNFVYGIMFVFGISLLVNIVCGYFCKVEILACVKKTIDGLLSDGLFDSILLVTVFKPLIIKINNKVRKNGFLFASILIFITYNIYFFFAGSCLSNSTFLFYLSVSLYYMFLNKTKFIRKKKNCVILFIAVSFILIFMYFYKLYIEDINVSVYLENNPCLPLIALFAVGIAEGDCEIETNRFIFCLGLYTFCINSFINNHLLVEIIANMYKLLGKDLIIIKTIILSCGVYIIYCLITVTYNTIITKLSKLIIIGNK